MLNHCMYDKIKLVHELSSILWFIEKHGKHDAKAAEDMKCHDMLEKLALDLEKYVKQLEESICTKK